MVGGAHMKYLFILGMSGSGKTTLAENIQNFYPKKFKKAIQTTTREPRPTEQNGREYYFISDEVYDNLDKNEQLFGRVQKESLPARYGTNYDQLDSRKTNIIVLSIEGFIDAFFKIKKRDKLTVLFISDVQPEVARENRNTSAEETYIKSVLHPFKRAEKRKGFRGIHKFNLLEIPHEELKEFRNNKKELAKFLKKNKI